MNIHDVKCILFYLVKYLKRYLIILHLMSFTSLPGTYYRLEMMIKCATTKMFAFYSCFFQPNSFQKIQNYTNRTPAY